MKIFVGFSNAKVLMRAQWALRRRACLICQSEARRAFRGSWLWKRCAVTFHIAAYALNVAAANHADRFEPPIPVPRRLGIAVATDERVDIKRPC
jgi:hypothetical protein